ncbi:uncharacterized protein LOC131877869 isoform X2 [Tigriopus californicus]|uniref:uncharacterized protein LOC131877869 isoform X2 n=1 Tax=Tigriopus californicus TaxID=6832 RepID=UPI0027DA66AC|nr:uncharacterized protein LOC131877869 isoform X2 [Tigriopus californicus]
MTLSSPNYNPPGGSGYGAPSYGNTNAYNPNGNLNYYSPYLGYTDDLRLLMKLGQAALIVFMILAVVAIIYMLIMCCLACGFGRRTASGYDEGWENGNSGGEYPSYQKAGSNTFNGFNSSSRNDPTANGLKPSSNKLADTHGSSASPEMVPSWYANRRTRRTSPEDSNRTQASTSPVTETNASSSTTSSPPSTLVTNATPRSRNKHSATPSSPSSPLTKHTTLANLDETNPPQHPPQSSIAIPTTYLGPSEPETPHRNPKMRRPLEPANSSHLSDPHQNRALPSIPSLSSSNSSSTSPNSGPKSRTEKSDRKISSSTDRSQARSLSYEYEVPPQRANQGRPFEQTVSVTTLPQPFEYSKPQDWNEAPPPPRSRKPYSFSYTQNEFINVQSRLV